MSHEKDAALVEKAKAGDKRAFAQLVSTNQRLVFVTCHALVRDADQAKDISQDVFVKAWISLDRFKGNSTFSTWLYRIAVNASLNHLNKHKRRGIVQRISSFFGSESQNNLEIADDTASPHEAMEVEQSRQLMQRAIDSLPEKQRLAFVLQKYDELSQQEIATVMETSESAVESLLSRAKANLQKYLLKKIEN